MLLNCLKKSIPFYTDELPVVKVIDDETAFKWWVLFTLYSRDRIIAGANKRISIFTHKHGVELQT